MDDVAFLHQRIESYADYTNDDARRRTDEQIRAYVGEAVARIAERLAPAGAAGEALTRVLLRCQFADQLVVRALDLADPGPAELDALRAADRRLVELADRADTVDAAGAGALLAEIDAQFDARAHIVEDRAGGVPPVR